jgi:hypothetical protein
MYFIVQFFVELLLTKLLPGEQLSWDHCQRTHTYCSRHPDLEIQSFGLLLIVLVAFDM